MIFVYIVEANFVYFSGEDRLSYPRPAICEIDK